MPDAPPSLTPQQMKALVWLAGQGSGAWVPRCERAPPRVTLDALVRRGLAVRSATQPDQYRITTRGLAFSPAAPGA